MVIAVDRSDVITLITVTYEQDDLLQSIPVENPHDVFCGMSSVSASEFFEAGRAGLNAELRATIAYDEYAGETTAVYNGIRYGVYRTYYDMSRDTMELYLERKAGA